LAGEEPALCSKNKISEYPDHPWEAHYELKPGDIYVEAGAFFARYGRLASKKVGPEGKVILIEPSPTNIPIIEEVVKSLQLENVTLVEKAVWNSKNHMKFCVSGNSSWDRLEAVLVGDEDDFKVIKVEADTVDNILDELGLPHVDLFAADVENAEVEMMQGMEKWLNNSSIHNLAIAAYHHPENPGAIIDALQSKGYWAVHENHVVYARI